MVSPGGDTGANGPLYKMVPKLDEMHGKVRHDCKAITTATSVA